MSSRRLVLSCGALTATFAAGYGVMFTVLDDFRNDYGISAGALGAVVAAGFFTSFLAQVLIAPLADRGHAKRLVFVGIAAEIAGLLIMAVGKDVLVLLAARVVMGVGAGTALPSLRRIVILADPQNLGGNVGTLLAADVAGFATGPAISAVLVGPFGIAAPFVVIAVVTAAFVPFLARLHVEERHVDAGSEARFAFDLLRNRPYVAALCMGSAVFFMIGTFDALWVIVLDDLDTAEWIANLGIVMFAVPMFFLGSVGGRLAQRVGPFRVGTVGLFAGACFLLAYGNAPSGIVIFWISLAHAICDGLTVSSAGVAVGLVAPAERQAGAQGLLGGTQTLTGGVSALLAGWLYDGHGRAVTYGVAACAMFALIVAARLFAGERFGERSAPAASSETVAVG
ncbi:MAG: MFS transporter [Acidimicrobiales bacterium]|nr:MFS transporter [Acidimicrobiales bacterium]